jgi:hypothetical protein
MKSSVGLLRKSGELFSALRKNSAAKKIRSVPVLARQPGKGRGCIFCAVQQILDDQKAAESLGRPLLWRRGFA